ncbi:aminotransferase class I/II-fold pyridoxal phosphate-dependent enzyme [Caldanaerobius polysaccharolyticus]|uniref:aminotransferase class I/II-fold pyridoxal phosphate-dependent enzyme n=1 Tax=Caldanaerobius polysaccharolyticus TaxID=44256 RepID=UPI00047BEDD8|nr:aminotransferase class I/II-fold pyridoxal phosphate-dependent enzyme [Caldanaerobius polysaccharolyticus]
MRIPILEALEDYVQQGIVPMHMPGHKQGRGFIKACGKELKGFSFAQDMAKMDATEVPGLDNLHYPEGPIKEAEELAARAFGADYTFFIVNGSTAGVYAMILSVLNPGDTAIVMRNSHRSVYNGLILGGIRPCYVMPYFCREYGIAMGITSRDIAHAMDMYPEAKAVVITSPNYYGFCLDIKSIADEVHKRGKLLLVDEAHGAHLHFSKRLPDDAIAQGADMAVQSAHKTLCAFTQTAYLHVKSDRVNIERVREALRVVQSTSPSYMLMASLDYARALMEEKGKDMLEVAIDLAVEIRQRLKDVGIVCPGDEMIGRYGIAGFDTTKLIISMSHWGYSGYHIEKVLREQYKVQLEMSDPYNGLAMITMADDNSTVGALQKALMDMAQKFPKRGHLPVENVDIPLPPMALAPREAYYSPKAEVPLDQAEGMICGDFIVPYPPGIPVLCPGEMITKEAIECIGRYERVQGIKKEDALSIPVVSSF